MRSSTLRRRSYSGLESVCLGAMCLNSLVIPECFIRLGQVVSRAVRARSRLGHGWKPSDGGGRVLDMVHVEHQARELLRESGHVRHEETLVEVDAPVH